jgi:membrane protein
MQDLLKESGRFAIYLWRRFWKDECLSMAGILSYSTLLALVPLTAVAFAIISAFPVFDEWTVAVQNFVFENLVPAAGETVEENILAFVDMASQLTTLGTIFLLVTALWLIASMEQTFNKIWRVHRSRTLMARFTTYWAALTVSPLLLGASLALTSYLTALWLTKDPGDSLGVSSFVLIATPFLASMFGITLLYLIVPNRRVSFRHAFAGGIVAAVLFELAKRGFAIYITNMPSYQAIYGALATIPIFLIWIFLSWLVILLGAEFSASLQSYRRLPEGATEAEDFYAMYRILGQLSLAQQDGRGLGVATLMDLEPRVDEEQIMSVLARLERKSIVHRNENDEWMLSRDTATLTLLDVYREVRAAMPLSDIPAGDEWDQRLQASLDGLKQPVDGQFDRPLMDFFRRGEPGG